MPSTEIPMDALTALVAARRDRFTAEAERFRLARTAVRAARALRGVTRVAPRSSGTRITAADCA